MYYVLRNVETEFEKNEVDIVAHATSHADAWRAMLEKLQATMVAYNSIVEPGDSRIPVELAPHSVGADWNWTDPGPNGRIRIKINHGGAEFEIKNKQRVAWRVRRYDL